MSRRRGKKGSLGRDFAPLYEPVMRADAVRTLPLSTYKLWTVAVALCKPWNNGAVPLTRSVLAQFGLTNSQAVTLGTKLLIERRLIVQTRKAISRRAALFAVTHLPLNHDAMNKVGAREPASSPCDSQSTSADCPPVHERTDHQSTNGKIGGFADCSSVENTPIPPPFADCSSVASKNLPCTITNNAHLPPHLNALMARVAEHGGSVTAGIDRKSLKADLRVRWWHGDPPAELAGALQIHAAELFRALRTPSGVIGVPAAASESK